MPWLLWLLMLLVCCLIMRCGGFRAADGTFDRKSLHGSCPTTKGTKFSATKWYDNSAPIRGKAAVALYRLYIRDGLVAGP